MNISVENAKTKKNSVRQTEDILSSSSTTWSKYRYPLFSTGSNFFVIIVFGVFNFIAYFLWQWVRNVITIANVDEKVNKYEQKITA